MKMTFTFSDTPELSSLKRGDYLSSHFKFPDEALQRPDCKERILTIAALVGKLTWACLHLTCYELGLKNYPIRLTKTENKHLITAAWTPMVMRFDQVRTQDQPYQLP